MENMLKRFLLGTTMIALVASSAACGSTTTSPSLTYSYAFASRLLEKGSAWRSIPVVEKGTMKVQLITADQSVVYRLGVGTVNGTSCTLSQTVDTAPNSTDGSPQITLTVAANDNKCVLIQDIGNLTTPGAFTITIYIET